ncbi:hypothetical protein DAPPUDRAFT_247170 [Daphnia pulex]|uniref:Uncharacterized protein n=1 Tax=Daphnia pulex TaxID=6669 RepID=E9GRW1_DAPPU|nr:hypothetical protein DAPPUDRAFT_247170 [Daphnia pulex]|eukprot:EFX77846.1 hypothetical protein DAPPUDRAFT_247170 [Daphnia pulex]
MDQYSGQRKHSLPPRTNVVLTPIINSRPTNSNAAFSCPDVSTLVQSLQQALALEAKFQPKLQLLSTASNTGVRKQ